MSRQSSNVFEQEKKAKKETTSEFESAAPEKQLGVWHELLLFIMENKKWWLLPIVAVFVLVSLAVTLASTGAAPFVYTLF